MNRVQQHRIRAIAFPVAIFSGALAAEAEALGGGGTIYFTGQIVAAPYEIAIPPPRPAGFSRIKKQVPTELVFERQFVDRPSANLQVDVVSGHPLHAHFTNSDGTHEIVREGDTFSIGQDGGTLAIWPSEALVHSVGLVTVEYD